MRVSFVSICFVLLTFSAIVLSLQQRDASWNQNPMEMPYDNNISGRDTLNLPALTCAKHYSYVLAGSVLKEEWALKFFDSWGKLPSGILSENVLSFGHFDQCIGIQEIVNKELIEGRYCLAEITISNLLVELPRKEFLIGMCIPKMCKIVEIQNELIDGLQQFLNFENIAVSNVSVFRNDLCTVKSKIDLNRGDISVIVIFGILVLLVVLSTGYDYIANVFKCNPIDAFLCFSLIKNWRNLFKMEQILPENIVGCLYGIRCLSVLMLLFYWSYHSLAIQPVVDNYSGYKVHFLASSQNLVLGADIFFLLSGFLVTWNIFTEMTRSNHINILKIYLHRYLRLLPVLGAAILFCMTLFRYIGSGPLWNTQASVFSSCRKFWWSTLIFVQNFVNPDDMCLPHSWYLSVNMQLYVVSVLLLLPLYKWRLKFGWIIPCLVILLTTGIYFIAAELNRTQIETSKGYFTMLYKSVEQILYSTVSWLIGMLAGYVVFVASGRKLRMPKLTAFIGWIISLILISSTIFGTFIYNSSSTEESTLIRLLSKLFCSLSICWMIFACSRSYGGPIQSLLTCQIWQPFSKLCYAMFVLHFLVLTYRKGVTRSNGYLTVYDIVQQILGQVCITTILSIVVVLFIEMPFTNIEKSISKLAGKCYPKKSYDLDKYGKKKSVQNNGNSEL